MVWLRTPPRVAFLISSFSSWSPMGGYREAGDGGWGMVLLVELGVAEVLVRLFLML